MQTFMATVKQNDQQEFDSEEDSSHENYAAIAKKLVE
jgi:hypothetical protein